MNVAPQSVSGRVVKTSIGSPASVRKCHRSPLAATDPVGLQQFHRLRPIDGREIQQFIGIVGDAEEPLIQVLLDDRRLAALANTVVPDHLFTGQGRVAVGAPIDR